MVLDILLDVGELNQSSTLVLNPASNADQPLPRIIIGQVNCNIVLERWSVSVLPAPPSNPSNPPELPLLYKQGIILFRTLYAALRTLPAYELSRKLRKRRGQGDLKIGIRMSTTAGPTGSDDSGSETGPPDVDDAPAYHQTRHRTKEYGLEDALTDEPPASRSDRKAVDSKKETDSISFAPINTPLGPLFVECRYRRHADFSVHDTEALLSSRFLNEDFFKPSVPLRMSPQGYAPPHSGSSSSIGRTHSLLGHGSPSPGARISPSNLPDPRSTEGAFVAASPRHRTSSTSTRSPSTASPIAMSPSPSTASQRLQKGSLGAFTYGSSQPSSSLRYTSFSRRQSSEGTSPARPSSLSSSRPSFPRYTSSRYGRSLGQSSVGDRSTAGSPQPWEASSAERQQQNTTPATSSQGTSILAESFQPDSDDIGDFLNLIDSRPTLNLGNATATSVILARTAADERLRRLAQSRDVLTQGLPTDTSSSRQHTLHRQSIEEELEPTEGASSSRAMSRASSEDDRHGVSERKANSPPTLTAPFNRPMTQPSSFPRYEQSQVRRPNVQTGFFHSTSTSPEANHGTSSGSNIVSKMPAFNRTALNFPRYIPIAARGRSEVAHEPAQTLSESTPANEPLNTYNEDIMGQLELSMEEQRHQSGNRPFASPWGRPASEEQTPSPALPALHRGRARPASHSRTARTPQSRSAESSVSSIEGQ